MTTQNQHQQTTEEKEKKAAADKLAAEKAAADKLAAEKAAAFDLASYNRYIELKFIKLDGGELRENIQKEFVELEKKAKQNTGKKPKKTLTASVKGNGLIRMVKDIAVPQSVYNIIKKANAEKVYFS